MMSINIHTYTKGKLQMGGGGAITFLSHQSFYNDSEDLVPTSGFFFLFVFVFMILITLSTGGNTRCAPVLHWDVIYQGITEYLSASGALRNLYTCINQYACTHTSRTISPTRSSQWHSWVARWLSVLHQYRAFRYGSF